MTETEILRSMLDERGVEWDYGITGATTTRFNANGVDLTFTPMRDGLVCSTILTPEQAVAATLGRGTCHNLNASLPSLFECDECGYSNDDTYYGSEWHFKFCPNCGRKVVDE